LYLAFLQNFLQISLALIRLGKQNLYPSQNAFQLFDSCLKAEK